MTHKQRIAWLDGVRGCAMLWILFVHFIAVFTPNVNVVFPGIAGKLLFGISGKLMVACFCVILGYFASKPSAESLLSYALRRYLFFAIQILFVEMLYYGCAFLIPAGSYLQAYAPILYSAPKEIVPLILKDSFLLTAQVMTTFWCVDDFLLGSILVAVLEKLTAKWSSLLRFLLFGVVFALLCTVLDRLWVGLCVLGWCLRMIENQKWEKKPFEPFLLVGLLLLIPWLIRRGECGPTYIRDGIACLIALVIVMRLQWLQSFFSLLPLSRFGEKTHELFLLHVPVYHVLESVLMMLGWHRPSVVGYVALFVLVFALTTLLAFGWSALMKGLLSPLLSRMVFPSLLRKKTAANTP